MNNAEVEKIADAFRKVLGEEDANGNYRALVKRIPIISADIILIKADIRWLRWLVMGTATGIGTLLIGLLTILLTK